VLQVALVVAAFVFAFFPRRKSPLQLAALTAVLIAGFELVQTYWLYTYIPWFFPFAAIAVLSPAAVRAPATVTVPVSDRHAKKLDPFGVPAV
jgi:apolipoprotein N-acyltransferase